jgi:tripartite-type tricarboxylate transporter receptor subunit TctC
MVLTPSRALPRSRPLEMEHAPERSTALDPGRQWLGLSILLACATAAGLNPIGAAAQADAYPARVVRIVNSLSAGSSADHLNRALADGLSARLNQRVLVENRPGDGGNIAAMAVVRAPADGHVLLMASTASLAIQMTYNAGRLEYDLRKDLAPISTVAQIPNGLFVSPSLPVNTLEEFVAYAKARPRQLSCASSGVGGLLHLTCELFKTTAGLDIVHVPYKGSTAIRPDLIEGRVALLFDNIPVYVPLVQSGKLKVLAVTSPQRAPILPAVPTATELGMPALVSMGLFGLFAPLTTNPEVVGRLSRETISVLADAGLRDKLAAQGIEPAGSTPQALRDQVAAEVAKWAAVIKDAGIRKE